MDRSLDDIIKSKRGQKQGRGRGSGRGGVQRNTVQRGFGRTTTRGGMVTKSPRGRGGFPAPRVADARMRIIQKKRQNMVDARDQLGQLAKQSDAREKLLLLRTQNRGLRTQTGRGRPFDARRKLSEQLTAQLSARPVPDLRGSRGLFLRSGGRGGRGLGRGQGFSLNKPLHLVHDIDITYDDEEEEEEEQEDYMDLILKHTMAMPRRTVNNPLAGLMTRTAVAAVPPPLRAPVLPAAGALRVRVPQTASYSECYYDEQDEEMEVEAPVSRQPPVRERAAPLSMQRAQPLRSLHTAKPLYSASAMRQDWPQAQRTSGRIQQEVESGCDIPAVAAPRLPASRSGFAQPPPSASGFKVMVTNLQSSVTEEDIKELFGDVGPLMQWRLLRPGTAEVVYRQRSHAVTAVDIYHKRQLDGQPMSVVLVSAGAPTAAQKLSPSKMSSGGGRVNVQPDLGIIHKALFKH